MTVTRIPAAPKDVGILSDVLVSAIAATSKSASGVVNKLKLRKAHGYVVLVVDGLGVHNLDAHLGHAPNIGRLWRQFRASIRCEFPSTTVVSLTGLATGLRSAQHGLIGYNVADASRAKLFNLLSGWETEGNDPEPFKSYQTLSEAHSIHVVTQRVYEYSGFTSLTMPSAIFHGVDDIESRFDQAARIAERDGGVVYLYVPELDQVGHRFGAGSDAWLAALEQLDSAVTKLTAMKKAAAILTADHGMVNVDEAGQIYIETLSSLSQLEFLSGGDTRSALIYFRGESITSSGADSIAQALREELGDSVWVCTWNELEQANWVAAGLPLEKQPNVVLMARGAVTLYDRRTAKPRSLLMKGHHGSITDAETQVPLLKLN